MDKNQVVASVSGELYATERAVDAAIAQTTTLVQAMLAGRAALDLSPVSAADAQSKAVEAIAALGVARAAVIDCHAELQKDHRRLGWGVYAAGPLNKPNDWETPIGTKPPSGHLRVA